MKSDFSTALFVPSVIETSSIAVLADTAPPIVQSADAGASTRTEVSSAFLPSFVAINCVSCAASRADTSLPGVGWRVSLRKGMFASMSMNGSTLPRRRTEGFPIHGRLD